MTNSHVADVVVNSKTFKELCSYPNRCDSSRRLMENHPNHYPIIFESKIPLTKFKMLASGSVNISELLMAIRKKLLHETVKPNEGIYLVVGNTMCVGSKTVAEIYLEFASDDGFLYITICKENIFG